MRFLCFSLLFLIYLICLPLQGFPAEIDEASDHLFQAAIEGNLREVRIALKYGAPVDARDSQGRTPLMLAVIHDKLEIVKELFQKGASLEAKTFAGDRSPLLWAVFLGNERIVQYLLSVEADVNEINSRGDTPLVIASYMGHLNILQLLLAEGADINHRTTNKLFTALHFAAFRGHPAITQILLENKAEVDPFDSSYRTPLMLAALTGHTDVIDILHSYGAWLDQQDNLGYSALLICTRAGNLACTSHLMILGSSLNLFTKSGDNILTLAAQTGNMELLQYVTLHCAEFLNDHRIVLKALSYAEQKENKEISKFLTQFIDPDL